MTAQFSSSVHTGTPTVQVLDNRGLAIRSLQYHRHPDTLSVTNERITYQQFDIRGFLMQSIDARLKALQATDPSVLANFRYQSSLAGDILRTDSVDAGTTIALNDIAGRPLLAVSATGVTSTWCYETANLPGRLLAVMEQPPGEENRVTERRVWAGATSDEQDLNLAGQCVRHYDTAGLSQVDSVALTESPLSLTHQLLPDNNAEDGRYLLFERTGAVSNRKLAFAKPASAEQAAILTFLSDVIVQISYTAKDGGEGFASLVQKYYVG